MRELLDTNLSFLKQQEVFHPTTALDIGVPLAFVMAEVQQIKKYVTIAGLQLLQKDAPGLLLVAKQ